MRECPNRKCTEYDPIGSERSCNRGKDPNTCEETAKWTCGSVVVELEHLASDPIPTLQYTPLSTLLASSVYV